MSRVIGRAIGAITTTILLAASPGPASAGAPASWEVLPAPPPLPALASQGELARGGARIWYAAVGKGPPVVLLHGGLASADSWGFQIGPLVRAGHRVVLIDSRGQGRSSAGAGPLHYADMADDVLAVLDRLGLGRVDMVGWSDGAIVSLIIAMRHPGRLAHVYAFGANMDLTGSNRTARTRRSFLRSRPCSRPAMRAWPRGAIIRR